MIVTLVLFRPFIVIDVRLPIPDETCCSLIMLGDMSRVKSIAIPLGLYTLFYDSDEIVVVILLRFQNCFLFCKLFLLLCDSSSFWFLLNIQCQC